MKLVRAFFALAVLVVLALPAAPPAAAAPPAQDGSWCGTHALTGLVSLARHEAHERHLAREQREGRLPLKMAPKVTQVGQIAVIEDNGTLFPPPKRFDLQGQSMQFLRRPKGMSAVRSATGFLDLIGDKVNLGDDASVRVDFPANFRFPFGDRVYDHAFINSDGNITFGQADSLSASRSLERFLEGPPRIAPLFTDLDPSSATGTDGVYFTFLPSRFRITWVGVPEFGATNRNTFQITLFSNGRVLLAYGDDVDASQAITGVNAFGDGNVALLDYDQELPFRPDRVAIAEEFVGEQVINDLRIAEVFFQNFRDVYDHISAWTDFPVSLAGGGAFAYAFTVKNTAQGFGVGRFNAARQMGLTKFEHFMQMGPVSKYSADPEALVNRTYTSLGILAHEAGHRWLAFIGFRENGQFTPRLLGAGFSHWSFHLDTDGSLMEGNDLEDRGDGSFITTERTTTHFSLMDQYLMGLVPAGAVPGFFYVDNADAFATDDVPQRTGNIFRGDRVNANINDVIAANGQRLPRPAAAKKDFRTAFILVTRPGQAPTQASLDKLEEIRLQYPAYWSEITNGRSSMKTALFPK